jgi:hypothetical protein
MHGIKANEAAAAAFPPASAPAGLALALVVILLCCSVLFRIRVNSHVLAAAMGREEEGKIQLCVSTAAAF